MKVVATPSELRDALAALRAGTPAPRIAFVPTMGYLHDGHLSLIDRARERADRVVVSIFVNPLQFGPGEDLERYPRDLERDLGLARGRGVDLVFTPQTATMYPSGDPVVQVVPRRMADRLCGAARPGHFDGVLTVVAKLFNLVRPDVAVFGQKDYQQAALIRRMVEDLDMGVEIDLAPTVREDDGLALSSRNVYLNDEQRTTARALPRALSRALEAYREGQRDAGAILGVAREVLQEEPGLELQYLELVDPDTLEPRDEARPGCVIAVAAFVGETRLIDNMILR